MASVSKSELKAKMLEYFREVERTGERRGRQNQQPKHGRQGLCDLSHLFFSDNE